MVGGGGGNGTKGSFQRTHMIHSSFVVFENSVWNLLLGTIHHFNLPSSLRRRCHDYYYYYYYDHDCCCCLYYYYYFFDVSSLTLGRNNRKFPSSDYYYPPFLSFFIPLFLCFLHRLLM